MQRRKFLNWLTFTFLIALIVWGIVKFGTILGFIAAYKIVTSWILPKTDINSHLNDILALVLTVLLYFGIYRLGYKKNKQLGFVLFLVLLTFQSAFLFYLDKDKLYKKYFTLDPFSGKYLTFDRQVYDTFGQQTKPVTFKEALDIYRQNHPDIFPEREVDFSKIKQFFNPRTGEALVYYYKSNKNGTYHFFAHSGFDPVSGNELLPVTPEIVDKHLILFEKSKNFRKLQTVKNVPEKRSETRPYKIKWVCEDGSPYKGLIYLRVNGKEGTVPGLAVFENPNGKENNLKWATNLNDLRNLYLTFEFRAISGKEDKIVVYSYLMGAYNQRKEIKTTKQVSTSRLRETKSTESPWYIEMLSVAVTLVMLAAFWVLFIPILDIIELCFDRQSIKKWWKDSFTLLTIHEVKDYIAKKLQQ